MKYAAAAAAIMIAGTGFCCTNPALAAKIPFIGKIFTEVQQTVTFSGTFDDKAEVLPVEGSSGAEIQNPVYMAESDGITITVSEVYCDGLSVFLTAEVNMEQGGLDHIAGNLLYLEGSWKLAGDPEEKRDLQPPGQRPPALLGGRRLHLPHPLLLLGNLPGTGGRPVEGGSGLQV